METQTIKNLLSQVSAIIQQYDKMAELTGENFNVFKILGVETKEVRMHSAFIAELLNPNGSHGQGAVFLQLFIEELKCSHNKIIQEKRLSILNVFDTSIAKVFKEEYIGLKSEEEGGRIDIVIKDTNYQIVIENKIYARDEEKQLVRYNNEYPDSTLLYLTLDGKLASEISVKKEDGSTLKPGKDYFTISYSTDILNWLESCKKEAVNQPILRESITQYINLIKYLTGQTMENEEKDEIVKTIIKDEKYINVIQKLSKISLWEETKKMIVINLGKKLRKDEELKQNFNLQFDFDNEGFWYYKDVWKYCIYFYSTDNFETIIYGIDVFNKNDEREQSDKDKFSNSLERLYEQGDYEDDWIWCTKFKEYNKISWYERTTSKGVEIFKTAVIKIMNINDIEKLMKA